MDKNTLVARVKGWAQTITTETFPQNGVHVTADYVGSFPKWPRTVNDEPVNDPQRHVRILVRLYEPDSLPPQDVARWSDAIRKAAEEDPTLGGAVSDEQEVRPQFREEEAILEVTATIPDRA